MKSISKKGKLSLNKQSIALLSEDQQKQINGGNAAPEATTSYGHCTGFTCCHSGACTWTDLTKELTTIIIIFL